MSHESAPARRTRHRGSRSLSALSQFSLFGLFVIAVIFCLYFGRYVLAPAVAGVLVGMTFGPVVAKMERYRIPSVLGAGIVVLALLGVFGVALTALAVPAETWSSRIPEITDELAYEWREIREPIAQLEKVEKQVQEATGNGEQQPVQVTVEPKGFVTNMISSAPEVVARIALFLGSLYFFLATRSQLRRSMAGLFPNWNNRRRFVGAYRDTEAQLSRYVLSVSCVNLCLGIAVGISMAAIGMPSPALWGALAAVLNFAPYIGPAIMAAILFGVGLVTYDGLDQVLLAPAVLVLLNTIEGQYITPMVLGRALKLNALVVFIAIAFWMWLWGPIGAVLAVPIVVMLSTLLDHFIPGWAGPATPFQVLKDQEGEDTADTAVKPSALADKV